MKGLFKVGDTVRRINCDNGNYASVGRIATVVGFGKYGNPYVKYPGCQRSDSEGELWICRNTELLERAREPQAALKWVAILGESSRAYIFPGGDRITVEHVTRLCVRPTSHRLETADGRKFIVPGKFLAIEINAMEWSA